MLRLKYLVTGLLAFAMVKAQVKDYHEPYRPQIHFSPKEKWMNDPNGMVFYHDTYHLFYQYYPDSTVWGPMHWGHATSRDLVHWSHQPIALYPDSLGYIFSGSAVIDFNNTSGLGTKENPPLVAIFTQHDPKGEKEGRKDFQNQSLAYSLDEGLTWKKYPGNPVLRNPGIADFRDPKVMWYEKEKKWIMTLAVLDHIEFYSSPNLKDWTKESEFGKMTGAHGGVWECPDLFWLNYQNKKIWILLVSINPGGPNGGSATQYFTGEFDGKKFTPFQTDTRWIDYGPDDYAGVTWSNTKERKIFLGWMGNWNYAQQVPTERWRSAMTFPRDLSVARIGDKYFLRSEPAPELKMLLQNTTDFTNSSQINYNSPALLQLSMRGATPFRVILSNKAGDRLIIGFNKDKNSYFIDRTQSGKTDFHTSFSGIHHAARLSTEGNMDLTMIIDNSSIELFADKGLTVMTEIFFPSEPFNQIRIEPGKTSAIKSLKLSGLKTIWP